MQSDAPHNHLLAIDLGKRCGLALYSQAGKLKWCRSQHFATMDQLRRAATRIISETEGLAWLISEGDVSIAAHFERVAMRNQVRVQRVSAEGWRRDLLLPRERVDAATAKQAALDLSRRVLTWSRTHMVHEIKHDTAEAVLIGLWGVMRVGWLAEMPRELRALEPQGRPAILHG